GSMGPTGELLEPMGSMSPAQCQEAFAEQARGLTAGGADLLWIETMSSISELEAASHGARSVSALPIVATLSFDTAGRTMMGVSGREAAHVARRLELAGIGANCGNNLADTEAAVSQMLDAEPGLVAISKGNAGIPEWRGAELHYDGTPELMAAYAHRARELGVRLIGSCCGSTPDHIAAMRRVIDGVDPVPEVHLGTATVAASSRRRRSRRRSA
ncbi:MAG: homocysteine S-methyltransferase family protein, partial [Acidimicrobiia bacterium]|nr:homocysteine S-methyltransferase family protein [Acidimicrobiia bacterium]